MTNVQGSEKEEEKGEIVRLAQDKLLRKLDALPPKDQLDILKAWLGLYADDERRVLSFLAAAADVAVTAHEKAKASVGERRRHQGAPDFMPSEFIPRTKIEELCRGIMIDYLAAGESWPERIKLVNPGTIFWLNEVVRTPNFGDVLMRARQYPDLPDSLKRELDKAAPFKGKEFAKTGKYGRYIIRKANRLLIEHFYEGVPKYAVKVVTFKTPKADQWLETRLTNEPKLKPRAAVLQYLGISDKKKTGKFHNLDLLVPHLTLRAWAIREKLSKREKRAQQKKPEIPD